MSKSIVQFILSECGLHDKIQFNGEYKSLSDEAFKEYKKLEEILSKEQADHFYKYVDTESDKMYEMSGAYFKEGMKFGLRLALECLSD